MGGGSGKKSLVTPPSLQLIVSTSPKNVTVFLRSLFVVTCDEKSSQIGGGGGGRYDDVDDDDDDAMWTSTMRRWRGNVEIWSLLITDASTIDFSKEENIFAGGGKIPGSEWSTAGPG